MTNLSHLKIAFLALTLGQGGAERQLYYMLKVLKTQGADVRVLSLTKGGFWRQPIEALGVSITWVGQSSSRIARTIKIIRELQSDPPHILQSQHFFVNLYAVLAARFLGISEIGAIRGDGVSGVEKIGKIASRLTVQSPRLIAANSQNAIFNVTTKGLSSNKFFFLPNVVNTELFTCHERKTKSLPIRILTVGRLVEPKRIDRFLDVLHYLTKKTETPVQGMIVGDGGGHSALVKQAVMLGLLPDHVVFEGKIEDVAPFYQQADIFLLTSDWEGTPNVLLEAMASGLPVVATNVGDVPRLIDDGETGFLVKPDDEELMVRRLLYLINNPERRHHMGERGREHVVEHYSLQRLPTYLSQLYQLALSIR